MTRYLVSASPSGETFVTDGTDYTDALYYLDWRQPDSDELRPDLDLYDFDLDPENGWFEEPDLRYTAEQEPGQPIKRMNQ